MVQLNGEDVTNKIKLDVPSFFERVLENNGASALAIPCKVFCNLLEKIAERSLELNDPQLIELCRRLNLLEEVK